MKRITVAACLALAFLPGAHAEVNGPCEVTIQGFDVRQQDSGRPDQAIPVALSAPIEYVFTTNATFSAYWLEAQIGPFNRALDNATYLQSLAIFRIEGDASMEEYAWLGSGLYQVTGRAEMYDGTSCVAKALIFVDPPLGFTPMLALGVVGAAAGATGTAAAGINGFQSAKDVIEAANDFVDGVRKTRTATKGIQSK